MMFTHHVVAGEVRVEMTGVVFDQCTGAGEPLADFVAIATYSTDTPELDTGGTTQWAPINLQMTVGEETVTNINSVLNVDVIEEADYAGIQLVDNNGNPNFDPCVVEDIRTESFSIWDGELQGQTITSVGLTFAGPFSDNPGLIAKPFGEGSILPIDKTTGLDWEQGGGDIFFENGKWFIAGLTFTVLPTTKSGCKNKGWQEFGFRNQGNCIQFVNTGKDQRNE